MSDLGSDLTLDEAGLDRLLKVSAGDGVISHFWINEMIAEIRRLRAENERLTEKYETDLRLIQLAFNLEDGELKRAVGDE